MRVKILVFVASLLYGGASLAQAAPLELMVNEGQLIRISDTIQDVVITNPDIADIRLTQDRNLFVYGKRIGETQLVVLGQNDRVLYSRSIAVMANLTRLQSSLDHNFPNSRLLVSSTPGSLILSGLIESSAAMHNALKLTEGFAGEGMHVLNQMTLLGPNQVNLKVRVMEMNRVAIREIGLNWDILLNPGSLAINVVSGRLAQGAGGQFLPNLGTGGGGMSARIGSNGADGSISSIIDALSKDQLVTVLAEPNLTSRSGSTASFFAGGEFPIPVAADNDQLTIEFKKFGVILDMTPTILSPDKIRLHIRPEVSELTATGAIITEGISIPGVAIRRTEATIELGDGQSFAVAGMFQNQRQDTVSKVPWLGDMDVLGPLFRSKKFQNSESELVIIATVNIVRPTYEDTYRSPLDVRRKMETGQNLNPLPDSRAIHKSGGRVLYGPHGFMK
ncbi:MAG: type II and III secretion system protein family protein [Sneathiella sp.]|nr:type II and III secretion system protein family protein [Sneathiella sp.]